jgi:hypothetical protein
LDTALKAGNNKIRLPYDKNFSPQRRCSKNKLAVQCRTLSYPVISNATLQITGNTKKRNHIITT